MSRTITIQKSVVAMMLGLKKTTEQIAQHYGVTEREMKDVLIEFGFAKARKPKTEPEYTINTVNDVDAATTQVVQPSFSSSSEEAIIEQPFNVVH